MEFIQETLAMVPTLLKASPVVFLLFVGAITIAVVLGLIIALIRVSNIPVLKPISVVFVEIMRGTPVLVQLVYIYFVLPALGVQIDSITAGIVGLGLNYAAYLSEVFRAAIESVDAGQGEAALSLGYTSRMSLWLIVVPQSMRVAIPSIGNYGIALIKDTSLTSVIAVNEILKTAGIIASVTFEVTQAYTAAAILYLAISLPLSGLVRITEWRISSHVR